MYIVCVFFGKVIRRFYSTEQIIKQTMVASKKRKSSRFIFHTVSKVEQTHHILESRCKLTKPIPKLS